MSQQLLNVLNCDIKIFEDDTNFTKLAGTQDTLSHHRLAWTPLYDGALNGDFHALLIGTIGSPHRPSGARTGLPPKMNTVCIQ